MVLLDFLLPFYYLLISSSRLLKILLPKVARTPNKKPNTPTVKGNKFDNKVDKSAVIS